VDAVSSEGLQKEWRIDLEGTVVQERDCGLCACEGSAGAWRKLMVKQGCSEGFSRSALLGANALLADH
jgi:hypothetical protein